MIQNIRRSLTDLLGAEYTAAVCRARAAHGRGVFRAKQVGKGTPDVLDHINSPFLPLRRIVYTSTNSMPSRRHSRRTRAA